MFKLREKKVILKEEIEKVLGEEFYRDISECKELLQLDDSLNNFFKKYALLNGFLKKKNLILSVYERRYKCKRYKVKKGVTGKNKVIRGISACVTQKFDGYKIINKSLQKSETKKHFEPHFDIVYECVMDDSPIKYFFFFFTNSLHLALRSFVEKKKNEEYRLYHPTTRQCYYCENYFPWSENELSKHSKNMDIYREDCL